MLRDLMPDPVKFGFDTKDKNNPLMIAGAADMLMQKIRDLADPYYALRVEKKSVIDVYNEVIGDPLREESGIVTKSIQIEAVIEHPLIELAHGGERFNLITVTHNIYDINSFAAIPKTIITIRTQPAIVLPNWDIMAMSGLTPAHKLYTLPDQTLAAIGEVIVFLAVWMIFTSCSFKDVLLFTLLAASMVGWDWLKDKLRDFTIGRMDIESAYAQLVALRQSSQIVNWISAVIQRIINANITPDMVMDFLNGKDVESLIQMKKLYNHAADYAFAHKPYETTVTSYWRRVYYRICGAAAIQTVSEAKLSAYGTILQSATQTKPIISQSVVKWRQLIKRRVAARNGQPLIANLQEDPELPEPTDTGHLVQVGVPSASWESIMSLSGLGNELVEFTYVEQRPVQSFDEALTIMLNEARALRPGTAMLKMTYNCDTQLLTKTHTLTGLRHRDEE